MDKAVWLFGFSGSGKTTLANKLSESYKNNNIKTIILDGDIIRKGISKNLGFSREDRNENIRRIAEISKLMLGVGIIPIVAAITPYRIQRELIKEIIGKENLILIYVKCSLEICEKRDTKQLYQLARKGKIKHFTGISDKFDTPNNVDIQIDTSIYEISESVTDLELKLGLMK